ncbi:MAG TPA: cyclase family protein [Acidimicrobiales bacterium]|nr:cyclase family protein [Acidimicrobiales bacterium]
MTDANLRGNWGRWGPDDERGALNLIGPEQVLAGVAACRTGRTYHLGLRVQRKGVPLIDFRPTPERFTLFKDSDTEFFRRVGSDGTVGFNEDVLMVPTHSGTHMDALSHAVADGTHYNGFPANGFEANRGASKCGMEKVGSVVGRAVLLDLPRHLGVDWLEPGQPIGAELLEACRAAAGVPLGAGDVLLVRTGWLDLFGSLGRGERPPYEQPGLDLSAAELVKDLDLAAVGADNAAVEVIPFDKGGYLPVHVALLHQLGVTLFEHLVLSPMAADGVVEGLFVAAPLLITGASGSPVNPVVIA